MPHQQPTRCALIHDSTKVFFRVGRKVPGYSLFDFAHGYIYGRWLYLYISLGKGDHVLARLFRPLRRIWRKCRPSLETADTRIPGLTQPTKTVADGYHGKVVTPGQAARLINLDFPLNIPDLEQVIPYVRARSLILEHPCHLAVLDCPCRSAQTVHCQPVAVCLVIGKVFVDFILSHHPQKSRRLTPDQALEILAAEARRGHVHHAFFKDAMLGRFYAICNCCACCCGAIKAHRRGIPMLAPSGYLAQVETKICEGCGLCAKSCQFGAISMLENLAQVNSKLCMGCGVCCSRCPRQAINLKLDERRGRPLEITPSAPTTIAGV